jgi:hypothetical protein
MLDPTDSVQRATEKQAHQLPQLCQLQEQPLCSGGVSHDELPQPCQLIHHLQPLSRSVARPQTQLLQAAKTWQAGQPLRAVQQSLHVQGMQLRAAADKAAAFRGYCSCTIGVVDTAYIQLAQVRELPTRGKHVLPHTNWQLASANVKVLQLAAGC